MIFSEVIAHELVVPLVRIDQFEVDDLRKLLELLHLEANDFGFNSEPPMNTVNGANLLLSRPHDPCDCLLVPLWVEVDAEIEQVIALLQVQTDSAHAMCAETNSDVRHGFFVFSNF